jgi:general L-amino acid transport system substrate-binding protein
MMRKIMLQKLTWLFWGLISLILINLSGCDGANSGSTVLEHQVVESQGKRLEIIKKRGKIICGIDERLLGFSYKEPDGSYSGISVDLCKAIAAALFDDPNQVEFRHLQSKGRFRAVVSGQVDLLSRNTTWTLSRDTSGGLDFPPTNFYDGQGLLVTKTSGITTIEDLSGKSICVSQGTTSQVNLVETMRKYRLSYSPLPFENANQLYAAYEARKCDVATADRSELVARRSQLRKPNVHQVLDVSISKEPLGPAIANGEPAWYDVVEWVTYAMIKAEELKINSQNVDSFQDPKNPEIRRFLGLEGDMGAKLGLSNDFARRVVKHVGNYSEVYERNIGEPFGLERGTNALWTDGGLMYAPPFR